MRRLPTFEGYTVDARLREFRKAVYGEVLEFVPFASPKGQVLLRALRAHVRQTRRQEQTESERR